MGLVGGGDDFGAAEMCAEVPLEARTTGVLGDVTTRVASATFGLNTELLWALPLPDALRAERDAGLLCSLSRFAKARRAVGV